MDYMQRRLEIAETPSNERLQYVALGVLSLAAAGLTGILSLSHGAFFRPYFGSIYPLLAIALVSVLGFISLGFLYSRGWFEIYTEGESLRGVALSATLATLFVIPAILIDLSLGFPRDMNVPPPQSLLFYPAIAFVAEISFHALPLSVFLAVLGPLFKKPNTNCLVWVCIVIASSLEPILHLRWGLSGKPFSWAEVFAGPHVFAFNLLQLYVFRRYDFVSMYSFRLVYYIQWHIIWGYVRLQWLF